jgi:nitrite reductase (NADH) large subunit
VKLKTDVEVMEYSAAFLQLYREEGFYLERTVHYLARVGMDYIKQRVLEDDDNRKALYERMLFSVQNEKDPWLERTEGGVGKHEFEMLSA